MLGGTFDSNFKKIKSRRYNYNGQEQNLIKKSDVKLSLLGVGMVFGDDDILACR